MADPVPTVIPDIKTIRYREIAVDMSAVVIIISGVVMSYQQLTVSPLMAGAFGTSMMYLFGKYTPNSAE